MFWVFHLVSAESLRICSMFRNIALDNDSPQAYFNYMHKLTEKHANDLKSSGKLPFSNLTFNHFLDTGATGNTLLNVDEAFRAIDQCDIVVGPYSSGQTKNVMPVFALNKIPVCSGSATNQALENKTEFPYFIRTIPNDNIQGKVLAQFVVQMKWKRINLMNNLDAFAVGVRSAFLSELNLSNQQADDADKVTIVADLQYEVYQKDFSLYLSQIKDSESTVVVFLGEPSEFQKMVDTSTPSQKIMFDKDYVWLGADTFGGYAGDANVLYSVQAADVSTDDFKVMNDYLHTISNSKYELDDLSYAPFYLSCLDLFSSLITAAKSKNKVDTFQKLGSTWFLNNTDLLSHFEVQGPAGHAYFTYDHDVISDFLIMQKTESGSRNKAFSYSAATNKILKMTGFKYNWSPDGNVGYEIDFSANAYTVVARYPFFFYFMIVACSIMIILVVTINSVQISKTKLWSFSKGLATASLLFGNIASLLFVLNPNQVIYFNIG
eukprot:NODE_309_length_10065_cov_0.706101.p1 type:complete len:492 gc:universal NODE_309_length_10065_cov_0.706101:5110-3635(-)